MAKISGYWLMVIFYSLAMASKSLKEGYDNLQWGKRLLGRLLTTIAQVSPLDCAEECLVRPGCLSFNYRRAAIYCELNYENDSSSNGKLSEEDGWIFSLRENWPMELTGVCVESTCSLNEKCERKAFGEFSCKITQCHPHLLNITKKFLKRFTSDLAVDFGSRHKMSCKEGYNQTGDGSVTCLWDGTWSAINVTCEKTKIHTTPKDCNYKYLSNPVSMKEGEKACKNISGYLLELETEAEVEFVNTKIRKEGKIKKEDVKLPIWLGATRNESCRSHFWWTENGACVKENGNSTWAPERPTNDKNLDCMVFAPQGWKDYSCKDTPRPIICEFENCSIE